MRLLTGKASAVVFAVIRDLRSLKRGMFILTSSLALGMVNLPPVLRQYISSLDKPALSSWHDTMFSCEPTYKTTKGQAAKSLLLE